MDDFLRQSTASQSRAIGPFISDTDFKTVQTGLTIANTDIKLVVNGGASANKNSGGATHRVNGVYGITLDATDTATVGEMEVSVLVSGALVVFHKFVVLDASVYDALFASSATGYSTLTQADILSDATPFLGADIDAAISSRSTLVQSDILSDATPFPGGDIDAAISTRSVPGDQMDLVNAPNATAIGAFVTAIWGAGTRTLTSFGTLVSDTAAAVWAIATATLTTAGTIGKLLVDNLDAAISSRAPASTALSTAQWTNTRAALLDHLDADVSTRATQADILSDATPFAGANIDAAVSTRATPAQVNAEVVDALSVDTYAEPTGVPAATATLAVKIGRLHQALRNEVSVDSGTGEKKFFTSGGVALWKKDFTDAAGVYDEGAATTP